MKSKSGFTIVELLIVIVVIAILATISIVAYNGIQQRANNTSTISAVNQVLKTIAGYGALNSVHPITTATVSCIVPAKSGACTVGNTTQRTANATFNNNLATIATQPISVPDAYNLYNGIAFQYRTEFNLSGESRPLLLFYSLNGNQQQCGVPNIVTISGDTLTASTTGYSGYSGGYTSCFVSVPNP